MRLAGILLLLASGAFGGEFAVLSTGFKIHADSHVVDGDVVRLQTDKGLIELPAGSVARFEREEYTAPPLPPPQPVATPAVPETGGDRRRQTTIACATDACARELVADEARKAGLPPALVDCLVRAESAYQVKAVSPKGAIGLMQLMPGTAASLKADPYDVQQNVAAGIAYLRDLLLRYEGDPHQVTKALAAYNAGPGAVDKYQGIPPYRETVAYVARIVRAYLKSGEAH